MIRCLALILVVLSCGVATVRAAEAPEPPLAMATAAKAFLATLDPARRAKASLPFNAEERLGWHFVPRERAGLPYGQMTPEQRQAAIALLTSGLSAKGYTKIDGIMHLESVLAAIEGNPRRDPDLYYYAVFGEPSDHGAWGWRYEGHHASLNWTILDGRLVGSSPQFLAASPADVGTGPRQGTRVLAAEEDLGRALVKSLGPDQRARAIIGEQAPPDILTGNARQAQILEDRGIAFGELGEQQQGLLLSLVEEYASVQPMAEAQARLALVKADLGNVKFAWMGGLEKGQGHYYRIQGSTFLIEYDNTQNSANHIHSVWREFKGDWGQDLLDEHYRTAPHHARGGSEGGLTP